MTITRTITNLAHAKQLHAERNETQAAKGKAPQHPHLCDLRVDDGIILQCNSKAGTYTWYLLYTSPETGARNQKAWLGRLDLEVYLGQAREKVVDIRRDFLARGIDPNAQARREAEAKAKQAVVDKANAERLEAGKAPLGTFEWLGEIVLAEDREDWKGDYALEAERALKKAYAAFGRVQLTEITWAEHIEPFQLTILAGKRANNRGNKSALQKAMRFVSAVFDEALERHIIKAIPIAQGKRTKKRAAPPPTIHHAANAGLSDLGRLVMQLGGVQPKKVFPGVGKGNTGDKVQAAQALQISLMTVQRRTTVIAMRWDNIDFDMGLWFIPRSTINEHGEEFKGAMKGRKVQQEADIKQRPFHVVPLPRQALVMLMEIRKWQREAKKESAYVFPNRCTGRGDSFMGNTQMSDLLNALGWGGELTQHGMRTVLKTEFNRMFGAFVSLSKILPGAADDLSVDVQLAVEIQLDHTHGKRMREITSDLGRTYFQAFMVDERKVMMQRWADELEAAMKRAMAAPAEAIEHDKPKLAHAAFLRRLAV